MVILRFAQADGRDAEAIEAGIQVGECVLEPFELREVRVHDLANLWMADVRRMPRDEQHVLDARIVQTLEQHAFAHHASGAENHDPHERRLQRTQR